MKDILCGACLVLSCTGVYALAFYKAHQKKFLPAICLLVICGLALRIYTASDPYLHEWDERYHALVAKHLGEHLLKPTLFEVSLLGDRYTEWTLGGIWLHKQPLPLWLIALSIKLFGLHPWAVRIPSVVMSAIGIVLIFDICRYLYDHSRAFIAAFLFSINGSVIELVGGRHATEHIDIAFMFFILLAVWIAVRQAATGRGIYAIGVGVSIGAAILCKWLPALIVIPVWALLQYPALSRRKIISGLVMIVLVCALVALPWQLYILQHYHREAMQEYALNSRHVSEILGGEQGGFFFYFECIRFAYGELIYLPIAWYTITSIKTRDVKSVAVLIWFWGPYIFFSCCATKMSAYTLFAAPAIFILTAHAYYSFREERYPVPKWLRTIIAFALILLPVRYTIERVKPFNGKVKDPEWNVVINNFAHTAYNKPTTAVFNSEHYIEMMFATDCQCYCDMPSPDVVKVIKAQGYTVLVQNGDRFIPQ